MSEPPTAPNGRPLEHTAPWGHSRASHRVHGYCAACPGIEPWQELVAWRARDNVAHDPVTAPAPAPQSTEGDRAHAG